MTDKTNRNAARYLAVIDHNQGYRALSALGGIFEPNMSSIESDNDTYKLLNDLAEKGEIE